jgi:hypothetical protein
MINMANRANVYVRLGTVKLCLGHLFALALFLYIFAPVYTTFSRPFGYNLQCRLYTSVDQLQSPISWQWWWG